MTINKPSGVCFVIAPIGDEGSEIRIRSDQLWRFVFEPIARDCGYEPVRADKIDKPGIITAQIIEHIINDPLVIADLSDFNPNVFYELALRHAIRKPVVQVINPAQRIPFDVASNRTIQVDHRDLDSVEACKDRLRGQIRAVEDDPSLTDNPISVAVELQTLRRSDDPLEQSLGEVLSSLSQIRSELSRLNTSVVLPTILPQAFGSSRLTFGGTELPPPSLALRAEPVFVPPDPALSEALAQLRKPGGTKLDRATNEETSKKEANGSQA